MTNDIKALIDYYEREKGLSREKILLALESAFLSAYRKMVPGSGSINYLRAEINVDKGKVRIFADLEVVPDEEYSDKFNQITTCSPPTSRPRASAASRCRPPARPCSRNCWMRKRKCSTTSSRTAPEIW